MTTPDNKRKNIIRKWKTRERTCIRTEINIKKTRKREFPRKGNKRINIKHDWNKNKVHNQKQYDKPYEEPVDT